jgi:hypothetical protein
MFKDVLERIRKGTLMIESNLAGYLWKCAERKSIDLRRAQGVRGRGAELTLDPETTATESAAADDADEQAQVPATPGKRRKTKTFVGIDDLQLEDPDLVDPALQSVLECLRDVVLRYYEEDPGRASGLIQFALASGDNASQSGGKDAERGAVRQAFAFVLQKYPERYRNSNSDRFRKYDMYQARARLRQLSIENCQFDISAEWGRKAKHGSARGG